MNNSLICDIKMIMTKKIFYLLFVFSLIGIAGCVSLNPLQFSHRHTDVTSLSFPKLLAKSEFTVKNPNPIGLQGTVEYEIWIKGQKFASGTSSTIMMDANGQASFNIETTIDMVKAFGTLSDLVREIEAGKSSVPFEIKGKFKSDIAGISVESPLDASGDLPLPKLPGKSEIEKLFNLSR